PIQKFWDGGPEETFFKKFSPGAGQTASKLVIDKTNPCLNPWALPSDCPPKTNVTELAKYA
ncbi:MAG: hypothetical protein LWY06_00675, partial [Firmicutes bacterium]|nr:hypothetical protein [Bacillota bacterium]